LKFYLESSVTVSAVCDEIATGTVLQWLDREQGNAAISDWVITETSAALSQKLRMTSISTNEHSRSLAAFQSQFAIGLQCLPISRKHFRGAARLAERAESGLRAGDALHLAICEVADVTLVTLDKVQARAGQFLGLKTLLLA
jgi:hypothetical protein